jgi:hypothetical protein
MFHAQMRQYALLASMHILPFLLRKVSGIGSSRSAVILTLWNNAVRIKGNGTKSPSERFQSSSWRLLAYLTSCWIATWFGAAWNVLRIR